MIKKKKTKHKYKWHFCWSKSIGFWKMKFKQKWKLVEKWKLIHWFHRKIKETVDEWTWERSTDRPGKWKSRGSFFCWQKSTYWSALIFCRFLAWLFNQTTSHHKDALFLTFRSLQVSTTVSFFLFSHSSTKWKYMESQIFY